VKFESIFSYLLKHKRGSGDDVLTVTVNLFYWNQQRISRTLSQLVCFLFDVHPFQQSRGHFACFWILQWNLFKILAALPSRPGKLAKRTHCESSSACEFILASIASCRVNFLPVPGHASSRKHNACSGAKTSYPV